MASLRKEKWRAPPTPGAERRPLVGIWRPPGDSPAPGTTYPRRNKGFCARRFRLPEDFEARRSAAKSGRAGQRDAPKASREGPFQVQGTPETPKKERRKGTGWHQHPRRTEGPGEAWKRACAPVSRPGREPHKRGRAPGQPGRPRGKDRRPGEQPAKAGAGPDENGEIRLNKETEGVNGPLSYPLYERTLRLALREGCGQASS